MQNNILTKTRWLVTIILLLSLGTSNAWGACDETGLTASPGVFVLDFYNCSKLSSTSGTSLTTANCRTHTIVPTGITTSDVITGVTNSNNSYVRYDMNGGLTLGYGTAAKIQTTLSIGSNFPVRKITVVGAAYDGSVPLYVAGTSVTLNSKGTQYTSCSNSTTITPSPYIASIVIKQNNGSNKKRSTLYTAVCEYGYRAYLTAPGTGSISATPKTANENGAGWNGTEGAVVGLKSTQKVTLTATPPSGYEVDAWTVKKKSDNSDVTASVLSGTTLTMPAYDVTVSVTWRSTAAGWKLKGSFDSWGDGYDMTGSGTVSVTRTLTANTRYEFKFVTGSDYYGNNGAIVHSVSDWTFATDKGNCVLYTGPAGDYTFSINTSTKEASITYPTVDHPNANYVYIKKGDGWSDARIYNWDSGSSDKMSDWAGSPVLATCEICGTTYYYGAAYFDKIIFRDGGSNQSNELSLDRGKWLDETTHASSWSTFATYTISFGGNGNTGGSMSDITGIACGTNQALTANAFTKTGYDFDGWKADVDVKISGSTVSAGTKFNGGVTLQDIRSDIELTAQWTPTSYSITYNSLEGATNSNPTSYTIESSNITLVDPGTRAGYTFAGWYTNEGKTTPAGTPAIATGSTGNKTFWAKWTTLTDTYKTALHTSASGWTSYASGVTQSGAGYTIPAPSSVTKGATSSCEDTHYHFAGWVADEYKGSPSGHIIAASGTADATGTTYWAVWEKEKAGSGEVTDEIDRTLVDAANGDIKTSANNTWKSATVDGSNSGAKYYIYSMGRNNSTSYAIRWNTNGYLYCSTAPSTGYTLKSVSITTTSDKTIYVYGATSVYAAKPTATSLGSCSATSSGGTYNLTSEQLASKYTCPGLIGGTTGIEVVSISITYSSITYEDPKAVCEACVATPSISGVSLTGSAFSTTSVPVQATGASAGDNCSLASYGFYWGGSANPTTNETASDNLSTGTFSATLTGPFTIGKTYHYRAFGTNEADNTGYSSDASFTLQNVSFNMHSHGGDAPATQVVPRGLKATAPSTPSETGYTFDGWWDNSSYTGSAWDFSTNTVGSGNVTLHAKWTEKPKYTITLNAGNGTISDVNWTNTSGSVYTKTQANGDEEITLPTPSCNCAGWVFQGWSTTSKSNAGSFTPDKTDGASFVPANNVTYYAVYRANATGGTTFNKITSTGDLTTGDYLFVASNNYAMKNVVTSSRMDEVSGFTSSNSSQTTDNANLVWTIIKFNTQVVIKNGTNYLGIDADNNICLTTAPHFFTYTYNGGSSRWEFTSATKTSYQLIYNSFFKIGTAQSTAIYLYKQGAGLTGNYYTNPSCSDISVTGVVSPEGSGTVTLTAGSGKTGDKVYAMYTPDEDYNFDHWSISGTGSTLSSTTALVTEITIGSAATTITANFVAKDWKTITWKANGVALSGVALGSASVKVENGFDITALPPTPTSCDGTSTTFIGWVEESDVWSGKTNDVSGVTIYEDVSNFPSVTDDVTYHAVWARQNGSAAPATYAGTGVFTKITTLEELEVGAHYVLYGTKDDDASVKGAMNNTFTVEASGKNVFGASAVTISDNKITNPATTIVWKLGGTTNAYTLYSQNSSKYVEITANDTRGYTNPSSPTTSFTITVSEGNFKIITNYASASSRMITIYTASVFRSYSYLTEGYTLNLYKYGSNYTYDQYLVKCCEDPELEFGQTRYSLIREDLHGNTSAAYSTIELTYSSSSSGAIRVWTQYDEDDNPEHSTKTAWQYTGANTWGTSPTTGGSAATASSHAYFAITDAENHKATFYVKNATASNGRGTYRVALHQAADATHCETVTYCWIDVTLRDKFVDAVNGNTFPNADAHGPGEPSVTTPAESTRDAAKDDDCHETTRRLVGWVKETDMESWYGTGQDRTRDLDDKTANITAPGATITTSGATWYAVWGIEE